ncbi:MAG: 3-phosphoglycerate dehydrogenase [Saprospiraceae bacterium]|nr:3-phosphoglycerate dehydrogenase [Saprospiraceae bacterium]
MVKILVNDGIEADGKLMLEKAGFQVDTDHVPQAELPSVLPNYAVIVVRSATQVRQDLIDACPDLKIIARGGVGTDNIDVKYAKEKGIEIVTTPAASSQSVAELAIGHICALSRFLHRANRDMATGDFKKLKSAYSEGIQMRGKTLGVVGFGRIGQETAKLALGMGINVVYFDPYLPQINLPITVGEHSVSVSLKAHSLEDVLKTSDFVSVHTPSVGKPVIGEEEIALMKDGAFLINCARGGVIDEDALLSALETGKIAGAGLDTFIGEPKPRPELLNHPRVSVSPHIGASTKEAQAKIGQELAEKIIGFFAAN